MRPKIYLETTIVSYLASRPSGEPAARVHQQLTKIIESLPMLIATEEARELAVAILASAALPARAAADALHIAIATVNAMDFLLSWNCTHIANAIIFRRVSAICREMGYEPPVVCTPEELMEG